MSFFDRRPRENESERAFESQQNEELVVIDEEGQPHPVTNPNQLPRGQALRDPKGEYSLP